MADNILRIILQTIAKGKGSEKAAKGLKKVEEAAKKAGERLKKDVVEAGKLAGQALVGIGIASIKLASDAEEMQGKFDTVFKTVGQDVTRALDDFSEAAGRNRFELRGMAAELGDLFKPLGFTEEAAGDMSVQMVKLAADLGSFNNMPMDEALDRLRGTLVGSHENALAFGVVINESTLKAGLAAKGWDKLTGAALNQAKAQVRLNQLIAGSSDAMGDSIRTAGSFANRLVRLKSNAEELGVSVGQKLLPVALELVDGLNSLISAGEQTNDTLIEMAQAGNVFEKAGASATLFATGADRLTEAFEQNKAEMLELVRAGKMTVKEFNRNVEATREAANEWDNAGASLSRWAGQMRDENIPAQRELSEELLIAIELGEQLEASDRALAQARSSLKNVTAEVVPDMVALEEAEKLATEAAKAQAAAARDQAESLEAARGRAADAAIEFDNLAQSLIDATNADLAKVALDNLGTSLQEGAITQGEYQAATRDVMLTFGLATEESLLMADSLGDVNQLYEDGKISADEYTDILGTLNETGGNLDQALGLLDITMGGINEVTDEGQLSALALTETQQDLSESVKDNTIVWGIMKDRLFEANKITDEAALSAEALRSPVISAGEAARTAAADFRAWAAAMVEANDIAQTMGGGVPLSGATPTSAPQFQHGGDIGRFGIVGDAGPELVVGNRVFSNPQTNRLIAAIETLVNAFPSSMGNTTNNINFPAGTSEATAGAHTRALILGGRR